MIMLNIVKSSLRISDSNYDFDEEINDLIEQCEDDLMASGVKPGAFSDTCIVVDGNLISPIIDDGNLRRAITLYCKAFFGLENPDKDWFLNQYYNKKAEMLNQITKYVNSGDAVV